MLKEGILSAYYEFSVIQVVGLHAAAVVQL